MRNFKLGASICLLAMAVTMAAGCGSSKQTADKAPLVKTVQAGTGAADNDNTYAGTVRGRYETNMSFQVGGQIIARNVQVGSVVRAGDVLMVIDGRDVVQKANQGDAQVASARAQLDLAQRNLSRYSELFQQNAVPEATLDQYQSNYDAAFASYQNALAQAKQFMEVADITGIILTKMDGTAKGGIAVAIHAELGVPVKYIGVGETIDDLQKFNADDFVNALFERPKDDEASEEVSENE